MIYFKISQDLDASGSIRLTGENNIGGYHEARSGDLTRLDNAIVSLVDYNSLKNCPDILDRQLYMVRGAVKQVFDIFMPSIEYKHCVFTERDGESHEQYYIPMLEVLNVNEALQAMEQHRPFFRVVVSRERVVVVSLEVVEAMLRRNPVGIKIDVINKNDITQGVT